ncbi:DUF881 domain-containing protein [Pontibacillus yanchengensis]|uniref:DUF881 domain-containing protein n=2 Tax=Pontibacillus yanchengensis TaxID=462910 RepID=A0ACC7VBK1_9BACI|nr:DUF881 domain-containing protein [Pontibacillus yanchengensis]MYL33052.1 DUF881 domain-containing protein [Pontibacillus yanchengensis]MYL52098.1 DUF881 domain-containing protein [Pontibacillus yanchengensis]
MKLRSKIIFSFIFALVGFMIAIQFQSNQKPEERDTRDLWEIRTELQEQQKIQQQLYSRITELDEMIQQYEGQSQSEKVATLKQSIVELRKKAGLTEVEGNGINIKVKPIFQDLDSSQSYPTISPALLQRLINELNTYGATDIAIGNERITNISPIRDVNGYTYINNHPIPPLPVDIKVLTQSPKRLLDYMQVSQSKDEFAIENLELSITVEENMTLPKYEQMPRLNHLKVDENTETGES